MFSFITLGGGAVAGAAAGFIAAWLCDRYC
jgi:hypothetical protein